MQTNPAGIIALLLTYLVFGAIGYRIAKKFRRPIALATWVSVIVLTIASGFVMVSAILLGIDDFKIYVNTTLQAIGVGIIIGLATRELRLKLTDNKA